MCNMQDLTKDTILGLLKDRFKKEIVYTYVGDIVVSVNPFKNTGCVGKTIRNRYKKGGAQNAQLLMPHCYHLVDQTYAQMLLEQKSQSILISGESGAGKTEAMKICLTYIGEISVKRDKKGNISKDGSGEPDPTAARLMQTNPVMEAIGNAKTVRNDNSSRFGKHFDIQFDDRVRIALRPVNPEYPPPRNCYALS
jgi:myosin heavy subunit